MHVQNVLNSAIGSICYFWLRWISLAKNVTFPDDGRQPCVIMETGQTGQTSKLDFPGNLGSVAFAILAMFFDLITRLLCLLKRYPRPATCKGSNKLSSKSWKTKSLQSLFHSFSDQAERRSKYIFGDDSEHWIPFKSHHCWHIVCKYRADLDYINIVGGDSDQAGTPEARLRMFWAVSFFTFLLALSYGWSAEHLKMHIMFRKSAEKLIMKGAGYFHSHTWLRQFQTSDFHETFPRSSLTLNMSSKLLADS